MCARPGEGTYKLPLALLGAADPVMALVRAELGSVVWSRIAAGLNCRLRRVRRTRLDTTLPPLLDFIRNIANPKLRPSEVALSVLYITASVDSCHPRITLMLSKTMANQVTRTYNIWVASSMISTMMAILVAGMQYFEVGGNKCAACPNDDVEELLLACSQLWFVWPFMLLLVKYGAGWLIDLHIANLECSDLTLNSQDADTFWKSSWMLEGGLEDEPHPQLVSAADNLRS
eukprot:gene12743-15069_t